MAARISISDSLLEKTKERGWKRKAMQLKGVETAQANEYVFENAGKRAEARFRQLSRLYDTSTIRHIEDRGIDRGWSCLEIGAGGGSITRWLCARVGVNGRVLAIDIDPQFLENLSYPNLKVWRHDIRNEGLPKQQFDLVHVRLVLMHLCEREKAWKQIVEALKPGGWVVAEEFDDLSFLPDPYINRDEESLKVRRAFQDVLTARGVNLRYGRFLPYELPSNGFVDVGAEASVSIWKGYSAGTTLLKLSCEELREPMLASGLISREELDADLRRMDEQDYLMPSPMMWTAWGKKPGNHTRLPETSDGFILW